MHDLSLHFSIDPTPTCRCSGPLFHSLIPHIRSNSGDKFAGGPFPREKQTVGHGLQGGAQRLPQLAVPMSSPHCPTLPAEARLWVYPSTAPLTEATQTALLDHLSTFIEGWTSHQHDVQGTATILHDRFLVLAAVRADGGDISGCGIDEASHAIDEAATRLDIQWVPSLHVIYRAENGSIEAVPRSTFQDRAEAGDVTIDTPVFDPSITSLDALRKGEFEKPAGQSWHARLFALPAGG